MISVDLINKILQAYKPISLEEAEKVQLFNRMDLKYMLNCSLLPSLLSAMQKDYRILEVHGLRNQPYDSLYFDTPARAMYFAHHNQHQNRYKIRFREYQSTGDIFLEIKHKTNQDRTIKNRMKVQSIPTVLEQEMKDFIENNTAFKGNILTRQIYTKFNRISLVQKNLKERVTIDTSVSFRNEHSTIHIPSLCIIEVKRELGNQSSIIKSLIHSLHIKPNSASKYCLGTVLLTSRIKRNLFKPTILSLNKICPNEFTSDLIANAS